MSGEGPQGPREARGEPELKFPKGETGDPNVGPPVVTRVRPTGEVGPARDEAAEDPAWGDDMASNRPAGATGASIRPYGDRTTGDPIGGKDIALRSPTGAAGASAV